MSKPIMNYSTKRPIHEQIVAYLETKLHHQDTRANIRTWMGLTHSQMDNARVRLLPQLVDRQDGIWQLKSGVTEVKDIVVAPVPVEDPIHAMANAIATQIGAPAFGELQEPEARLFARLAWALGRLSGGGK